MNKNSPNDLLTRKETAEILECDIQTVDAYRKTRGLPWSQSGTGRVWLRRGDVDAFKAERDKVTPHHE